MVSDGGLIQWCGTNFKYKIIFFNISQESGNLS